MVVGNHIIGDKRHIRAKSGVAALRHPTDSVACNWLLHSDRRLLAETIRISSTTHIVHFVPNKRPHRSSERPAVKHGVKA